MTQLDLPVTLPTDARQLEAMRRLAKIVRERRNSYECRRYRERRAAMLRFTRGGA